MFYLIRTLKEDDWKSINTDFILEAQDESIVKDFFNNNKIIILGISQVQGRPLSAEFFWEFQITEDQTSTFCMKADTIEAVVQRCIDLWLPIIQINNNKNPISPEISKNLINQITQKKIEQINKLKSETAAKKEKENKLMEDKKKEKILKVIEDTLQDIKKLEEVHKDDNNIVNEKRKLNDLKEQLTKIRMWSNLEKATSTLEETFALMEQIEMASIHTLKEQEQKIYEGTIVSNIDIIRELDKIKRAQQVNQAGTKKTSSDLYYTYLGIVWLYQKFIAKDIVNKTSQVKNIVANITPYFSFAAMIWALWTSLFFYYYLISDQLHYNILLTMIALGIFNLIRSLLIALFKAKTIFTHLLYIILAIIITIIIHKIILVFFALV